MTNMIETIAVHSQKTKDDKVLILLLIPVLELAYNCLTDERERGDGLSQYFAMVAALRAQRRDQMGPPRTQRKQRKMIRVQRSVREGSRNGASVCCERARDRAETMRASFCATFESMALLLCLVETENINVSLDCFESEQNGNTVRFSEIMTFLRSLIRREK